MARSSTRIDPAYARRGGVNTIIPGRLYQRANFLTWPYLQKKSLVDALGVNVVVNLWRPIDSDMADHRIARGRHAGHDAIYLNWHMRTDAVPDGADLLVGFLTDLLRQGRVMLVHCEAGRNRSAWLCTRLVAKFQNINGEQAREVVREAVPASKLSPALLADVLAQQPLEGDAWPT